MYPYTVYYNPDGFLPIFVPFSQNVVPLTGMAPQTPEPLLLPNNYVGPNLNPSPFVSSPFPSNFVVEQNSKPILYFPPTNAPIFPNPVPFHNVKNIKNEPSPLTYHVSPPIQLPQRTLQTQQNKLTQPNSHFLEWKQTQLRPIPQILSPKPIQNIGPIKNGTVSHRLIPTKSNPIVYNDTLMEDVP